MLIHSHRKRTEALSSEAGVSLAFFAVSALMIIAMVGLAIDTYLSTTSKSQYQSAADAVALAAIEQFGNVYDPSALNRDDAINAAITRAEAVLRMNIDSLLTHSMLKDPGTDQADLGTFSAPGINGRIQPGYWVTDATNTLLTSRCLNRTVAPCFSPISNASDLPDAFRVEINITPSSPIRTAFMSLVGIDSYSLGASATAVMQARRGVFLIDLSPSIHETTHSMYPTSGQPATLYAYPLNRACNDGDRGFTVNDIYDLDIGPQEGNPKYVFDHYIQAVPSAQDSFVCKKISLHPDEPNTDKYFAIDYERRPEPLATILEGVHDALEYFNGRALSGDRVGVFGFDDRQGGFLSIRSTTDSSGAPVLVRPSNTPGSPFEKMYRATAHPFRSTLTPSHVETFFFPQFFSNNPPTADTAPHHPTLKTDIGLALDKAVQILTAERENFNAADNFIVLFSDGKSNCVESGGTFSCNGTDARIHKTSMEKLLTEAVSDMHQLGISFHTVLVSDSVQPHNLLKINPNRDGCLDDFTSRKMVQAGHDSFQFVDWGDGDGDDRGLIGDPYHYANKFYDAVSRNSGIWTPLRKPCYPPSSTGDPVNLLDTASSSGAGSPVGALHRACVSKGATSAANGSILSLSDLPAEIQADFTNNNLLDDHGRLLCDPYGRTLDRQIEDFIDILMGHNPIRLVGRQEN